MKNIYFDNNIFDFLFNNKIKLGDEFPKDDFSLFIIREIELEIITTPQELNSFINETMEVCKINIDSYFGFYCDEYPVDQQRNGGFGFGRFILPQEIDFIKKYNNKVGSNKKKNGLYKNETDLALAARSFIPNTVVISMDVKAGPLRLAFDEGGKIIFFKKEDYDESNISFGQFIKSKIFC